MVNEVDFRRFRQAFNVSTKKEFADDELVRNIPDFFLFNNYSVSFDCKKYGLINLFITLNIVQECNKAFNNNDITLV